MAKQITKRTLAGYSDAKINAHYFDDLVNQMKCKQKDFIDKILRSSYWKKGDIGKMKFDAVVGIRHIKKRGKVQESHQYIICFMIVLFLYQILLV